MTALACYRLGALVGALLLPIGVARSDIWTVVAGGLLALYSLRHALLERRALTAVEQWQRTREVLTVGIGVDAGGFQRAMRQAGRAADELGEAFTRDRHPPRVH